MKLEQVASSAEAHPRTVLLGPQARPQVLPVCDHYCGTRQRMEKSLALQTELRERFGRNVFDVSLDCEDGAPVGGELEHAQMIIDVGLAAAPQARLAVRVHAPQHPAFAQDVALIVPALGSRLAHLMLPKIDTPEQLQSAIQTINAAGGSQLALHALIESPLALQNVSALAAHPRIASLSFGLMDFVSSFGGAIPSWAMDRQGQFTHPIVRRAKLKLSEACHAHGKTPAHCVVTEFKDLDAVRQAAQQAASEMAYTRMWSIHPAQILPIVQAFAPSERELEKACAILSAALAAHWAPIAYQGVLHDRASYRYFWQVLERAHLTGQQLASNMSVFFGDGDKS